MLAALHGAGGFQASLSAAPPAAPLDSDRLYNLTNVWTVHLKFARDQWEAMEPKGGVSLLEVLLGGARDGAGGPGGFGVANLLSPVFMRQGDLNHDGRLSRDEFATLAQKWFTAWDTNKSGKIGVGEIRAGLDSIRIPGGNGLGLALQGPEGKRNGLASVLGIEFVYVHADLEFEGRVLKDVAVRYKGNGTFVQSRGSLKRSLKIHLNKYVKGQKLGDVTMLTLQNNVMDASWMNEVLAYRLYRDAGVPAPRTAYAKVFVTVPGKFDRKYFGLYSISEDVDRHFAEHRFHTKKGAIFKPDTPALFDYLGSDWARYNQTYDPKTELSDDQKRRVMELCHLVTEATDAEFAARIGQFIDLPEFARYMAVLVWLSNPDSLLMTGQNFFLHLHPRTQLLEFIPWDQDLSFGQFPFGNPGPRVNLSILHPWEGEKPFLERMFNLEAFAKLYRAHLEEFSKTLFKPQRFAQQVDAIAAAIRPAVQGELESKLAKFDQAVAGESHSRGFGWFGGPALKPIKPFAVVRTQSVRDQLAGLSKGEVLSGFGFLGGGRPGMLFSGPLLKLLDENKDSAVTQDEFTRGFRKLFEAWNTDQSGLLTEEQLRRGINQDLSPLRGGPPAAGGSSGNSGSSPERRVGDKLP